MAFSPDGSLVLFTAFSENAGATVWRVPVSGEGTAEIVVSGLPFWGDGGFVILPMFVETTNETFTIGTTVISWEVEGGVDVGTLQTYKMDGDLLREVPKPMKER